jgi:hypothetical protein
MACAIGCWVRDTALVENHRDTEYRKAFINSMTSVNSQLDTTIPWNDKPRQWEYNDKMNDSIKTNKEYIWLLKG